jgi:hypothetical protein
MSVGERFCRSTVCRSSVCRPNVRLSAKRPRTVFFRSDHSYDILDQIGLRFLASDRIYQKKFRIRLDRITFFSFGPDRIWKVKHRIQTSIRRTPLVKSYGERHKPRSSGDQ